MLATLLLAASVFLAQADDGPPAAAEAVTAEQPQPDLAAQVKQLVRQLDAAELTEREAAEQQLIELGPGVLDVLPPVTGRTSAEVKERLGRIRDKLQRAEAESVAEPGLVTLQAEGMPLSQVLAKFQEQTGNALVDYREKVGQPARDPKLTLSLDKVPFWQALDQVLDDSGSTIYLYPEGALDALGVVDLPEMEPARRERPAAYAGPFRLEATRIDSYFDLRNPSARQLLLELELAWEPRLKLIALDQRLADLSATDDAGNPIAIDGQEGSLDIQVNAGSRSLDLQVPLVSPDRSVKKIASLKGKFTALLPGRIETFRFSDLKKSNQQQRKAGVVVTLESVRRNNELYEIRVRVRFDEASGALQSHMDWIEKNEASLESSDGKTVPPDTSETTRRTEEEAGMAYLFALEGKLAGHTFVYKTPAVIVEAPVEYEIKDLPLP